ncbi:MAG: bifunctional hydroxymethylpyrimidine kinase/phosphomethylpyrimidine kinase [Tannerellaceae bacterium]|nr:bifunctional hydroxymethylpyrimidine kinase/phosphomethylpyrimidine kinase [Tannerellaceae bacterium]
MTDYKYRYPAVLTIAGSDSSGGAGIQADLKTISSLGVYGASAITAITAQNTLGVRGIQAVEPEIVKEQISAVLDDIQVDAIKLGMLHNRQAAQIVADAIDRYNPAHVVLDPVMISTSGSKLIDDEAIETIIRELFPRASLITPNTTEAGFLSGITINRLTDMEPAARKLLALGCKAVLIKGGHLEGEEKVDILYTTTHDPVKLSAQTVHTFNTHGTGCSLSSAIASFLAMGAGLPDAVRLGKEYITQALEAGKDIAVGKGHGPVNHFFHPLPLLRISLVD